MAKVRDYFQAPVWCVRETDDLAHARQEMLRRDVRKLVVLDERERVSGILSITDLVEDAAHRDVSEGQRLRIRDGLARDVMTRDPFTVDVGADARVALRGLARQDVSGAPALDAGDLAGIVTLHDLLPFLKETAGSRYRVVDVMNPDVVRVHRHDTVVHAMNALHDEGARAAVVTEAESGVTRVGVITLESIVFDSALESIAPRGKRIKSARKRDFGGRKDARHVDIVHAVVEDAMWEDHPVIRPDAGLANAVNVFLHEDVDALPVVEGDAVVGMLSKKDLARTVAHVPA